MRLRSKVALVTALASILPVGLITVVGRDVVIKRSQLEFAELLEVAETEVKRQYSQLEKELEEKVKRLAQADDRFTGRILLELAQGSDVDATLRRTLREAPQVMRGRGLDVLTVVGPDGRVLANGHFPGRTGDRAKDLAAKGPGPVLLEERIMRDGRPITRLTLQATRQAQHQAVGSKVRVVGGVILDNQFLRRIALRGDTIAVLLRDDTLVVAGPAKKWKRHAGFPQRRIDLGRLGPKAGKGAKVSIVVSTSDTRLGQTLQDINTLAGILIAAGVLLSLLLAGLARRITRPLEALAKGAEAVAGGDLEYRIDVKSQDEVGNLVAAFNHMTHELKVSNERLVAAERVAAWREIARRIAHEIKNPLFPMQTSMETLRKVHQRKHPDFDEILEESTTTVLTEVGRLKRIVGEFSSFARMPQPQKDTLSIGDVIAEVMALYRADAAVALRVRGPESLPAVHADREQLKQVLVNLIKNSKEAGASEVVLALASSRGVVEIRLEDNGPGLTDDARASLFTPYFTTKAKKGGSGLGLSIVQQIISDHGGTIEAKNGETGGAEFIIRLPQWVDKGETSLDGAEHDSR